MGSSVLQIVAKASFGLTNLEILEKTFKVSEGKIYVIL